MAVTFDVGIDFSEDDSTTPTAGDIDPAATANRYAIGSLVSLDFGGLATHDGMTLEGVAMSPIGSAIAVNAARLSTWGLVAPSDAAGQNFAATFSDQEQVGILGGAVYNGVHQSTPIGTVVDSADTEFSAQTSISPTATATTVTDGMAHGVIVVFTENPATPDTITPATGCTIIDTETRGLNTLVTVRRPDNAGSTAVGCTLTYAAAQSGNWRVRAIPIQPAAGGAAAAKQLTLLGAG